MSGVTRMRGADAGFLYIETPAMHMHTLKIALLEPSPENTYDNLVATMLGRIRRLPPLRRRVIPVPLALNHPMLVTEREFDPRRHFFRHDIGGTGSMRDLERLIGQIGSTPLDRRVPLWELHLCEGLADGGVAIVAKMHHALADGAAANALLANVMDIGEAGLRPEVYDEPEGGDEAPSRIRLVVDALRDAILQIGLLPGLLVRTVRALAGMLRYRRDHSSGVPLPFRDTPRVSFNGPLTPRRSFATVTLALAELKRVRTRHEGVSLNDVVLAVTSGALRRWLAAHDEQPAGPLTAGVPVGLDARGGEPRLVGNNVSNLFTTLATDIADPAERLRTISEITKHAKVMNQALGSSLVEWAQFTPPAPVSALMRAYSRHRGARLHRAPFSLIVSNVPGPRHPVKVGGAHIGDVFSVGPLVEGIGLNVTVWSYVGKMNFSMLACPDLLADVEVLAGYFPEALAELLGDEAVERPARSAPAADNRQESA